MPVCTLKNTPGDIASELTAALRAAFPHLNGDIAVVRIFEGYDSEESQSCTVHSSEETPLEELVEFRKVCARHLEVRERALPETGYVYLYALAPKHGAGIEDILQTRVTWVDSDPRLLNNSYAPYLVIHKEEVTEGQLSELRELVDVEVWDGDRMVFYPKSEETL